MRRRWIMLGIAAVVGIIIWKKDGGKIKGTVSGLFNK